MSLDSLLWAAVGGRNNNSSCYEDNDKDNQPNESTSPALKFLFVGGKGGVGKTTTSAAVATLLAVQCRKRVLLVSTDPAHSLSDAFRMKFGHVPTPVFLTDDSDESLLLHVVELNPTETMQAELGKWAQLADDLMMGSSSDSSSTADCDSSKRMAQKIHSFQEWLSGIPGIDEATALASAIRWIESDQYDLIVFDTAPTGHTLKLLQMPDILQQGIERLQGWQSTLWGYWEVLKGSLAPSSSSTSMKRVEAKAEVAALLEDYKRSIQKVALMLQDQQRTRFAVVCIAEYLSVSETQRLLQELHRNRVRASHVVVNQLVIHDALNRDELAQLEALAEVGHLQLNHTLLAKTVHANRLTTARKEIQEKYLAELRSFPEAQGLEGICEMPLLPNEVTGVEALQRFGELLVRDPPRFKDAARSTRDSAKTTSAAQPLYDSLLASSTPKHDIHVTEEWNPQKGDSVQLTGLSKSEQYNGLEGTVTSDLDPETGRFRVTVVYNGETKALSLQKQNMEKLDSYKKSKLVDSRRANNDDGGSDNIHSNGVASMVTEGNVARAKQIFDDPEIKAMIDQNPRFADAVQDVMANPMNVMKYLLDPEMSTLVQKVMSKLQQQK